MVDEKPPLRFPGDFLLGAATASHQVEGGNCWNDWWEFEQAGILPYKSGQACKHYELYEQDFDLAQSLGHNAHRFSIEWSRVEPRPGEWSESAVEHYAAVIEALRQRGLEPVVTLHHFTNPAWFARRGGWTRRDSIVLFSRYVEFIAGRLAGKARFWITINEPTVYVKRAYVAGSWPPCESGSYHKAAIALRNMCLAHAVAFEVLHRLRPDAMVGFAHSAPMIVPCNPRRVADRSVAWLRELALNRVCFSLFGDKPREVLDFIGINYYSREIVRWRSSTGAALPFGAECRENHHGSTRTFSSLGWEVFAPGLRQVLEDMSRYGVPLLVSENGIATTDERMRTRFLLEHLTVLADAVGTGVKVLGYLYWSLVDNYEWAEGFGAQFGLAAVDFTTQQRTARPAALALKAVCEASRRDVADEAPLAVSP